MDTVQSAAAALDRLAVQRYDVLVSDLGLPEKDGLTLMREVRAKNHELRELPPWRSPALRAKPTRSYVARLVSICVSSSRSARGSSRARSHGCSNNPAAKPPAAGMR